jgi:hypothetical protein
MKRNEEKERIILLLKIDANNLFRRITERKSEYLEIFSLRRTRSHFPMIFRNRFETTTVTELSHCGPELILLLNEFYTLADEMNWYLYETQDLPNTVENFILRKIARMEKVLQSLNLFLDAEMGGDKPILIPEIDLFDDEEIFSDSEEDDTAQES